MGSSKRYRAYYAKLMDAQIEEFVMRGELIMLTAAELDLENMRAGRGTYCGCAARGRRCRPSSDPRVPAPDEPRSPKCAYD